MYIKRLLFAFIILPFCTKAQIISTIAGNGTGAYSGDGGPATSAELNKPHIAVKDATGNIYIADFANSCIRKINTSGIITTIAGTGVASYGGDGGPATLAQIYTPTNVFVDNSGIVYIADLGNNRIRKISTSGIITTIAGTGIAGYTGDGGPATLAELHEPIAVYVDTAGNIYISDSYSSIIRKINTSGIISTIAGTGTSGYNGDGIPATTAQLYNPFGITFDNLGNLYIADQSNNRVRKVNTSGIISTIAGNGTGSYGGDGGPATLAKLYIPSGIALDGLGNIFIADQYNHRIRKINTSGTISTIAGNGTPGYYGDGGPATAAEIYNPPGVFVDPFGNIYIGDYGNNRIRKISDCTNSISGDTSVCIGSDIALSSATAGGTWGSSNTNIATVTSTGIVTGGASGTAVISYLNTCGATATSTITVNANPAAISGIMSLCVGSTVTLSDSPTGGTWSSGNISVATAGTNSGIITGVSTGIATITYFNSTGCYATATVTVNPPLPIITGTQFVCAGSTTPLSDASGGGIWSSTPPGVASVGTSSGIVTGIAAGAAIISYSTSIGCATTTTVTVYPMPSSISGATNVCISSTTSLSNAVTGGTWSSNNTSIAIIATTTGVVTGLTTGITTITYTLPGGCYITTNVTVNAPPPSITGAMQVCTGATTALSDAAVGGVWISSASAIATVGSATGIVTGSGAGNAIISYSLNSCIITATVIVNQSPSAIAGATSICVGSPITLSDSPIGGTWSSSNTSVATITPNTGIITSIAAGITTITYTLPGGCHVTTNVTVNALPPAITGIMNVCSGATTTLSDATTGGTWASGSSAIATVGSGNGIVTGTAAGSVIVSYSLNGCTITTTVVVNQSPGAITGAMSICAGSSITLSDSPTGGTWSSSNTLAATNTTNTINGVAAGSAIITYSLPGGCYKTSTVTVYPLPSPIAGILQVCTGSTIMLSDTLSGGIWSSSNPATATIGSATGMATGVSAGNAVISYSENGCMVSASVTVNITPSISTGTVNICTNSTKILTGTPTGGIWSSSNTTVATIIPSGTGSGTVAGIATGTTIITYSLAGCFTTTTVTAFALIPSLTGNPVVCTGRSIILSDSIATGTWSSSNTSVATVDSITGIVTGGNSGNTVITYSLGGSCFTSATVTINQSPGAGIIVEDSAVCIGAIITLSDTVSGGVWSSSNNIATIAAGSVTGIFTGTDTISYIVSNAFCADTAIKPITVYPVPDSGFITGPPVLCTGNTISLSDTVSGGIWSSDLPGIATISASGMVRGLSAGTDTIKYTVSNPGCSSTADKTITIYDLPEPGTITGEAIVCSGHTFILTDTVRGGIWTSSNTTIATIDSTTGSVLAVSLGTATVTYTIGPNGGGCYNFTVFTVTVNTQADFSVNNATSPIKCYGDSTGNVAVIITGGTPPFQYRWFNNSTDSALSGLPAGQYIVNITETTTQCTVTDTIDLSSPDSISVTPVVKNDICYENSGSITLIVTGGTAPYNYTWSNNGSGIEITNLAIGTYSVSVTDMDNCTKYSSAEVKEDTCNVIVIHDVITPNGDGINDVWVIEGITAYPQNTVQVFDKWGDMVYEKSNYDNNWGGQGKNGALPDGTYYYLIKLNASYIKGGQNTWTGYLLIKR